nr:ATP-binding protein [uncultured Desulfobacter sp.]
MDSLSLRYKLVIFFCLTGLLPLVFISYYFLAAHTRSLEEAYTNQVNQIVGQAATGISQDYTRVAKDLSDHAAQPYLQLSFQQYPQSTRLLLLRERLELYRSSRSRVSRLSLCYTNGRRLVTTPLPEGPDTYISFERQIISKLTFAKGEVRHFIFNRTRELCLFIPVVSFRNPGKQVGVLAAYLPLSQLAATLETIDIGFDTMTVIRDKHMAVISQSAPDSPFAPGADIRRYRAQIAALGWFLEVGVATEDLFGDVTVLKRNSAVVIGAILVCALVITFIFSRRFTAPLDAIIRGTQTYATGDLTHRIRVTGGYEAQKLAQAFNAMAQELDERQGELDQAVRLASIGAMTAGLGHEIKNPLTGIKTSAQVISKVMSAASFKAAHAGDPEGLSDLCLLSENISSEADRVTKILNDLLKLGKPRKPNPVEFDLAQTVQKSLGLLGPRLEKKGIARDIKVPCLRAWADPDQIQQVLLNLLLNAMDAVPEHGGKIRVTGSLLESGRLHLTVCDNGPGIPRDKIRHIFDPFFSLKKEGTGLGLAVVYSILKQNQVRIEVDSRPGQGTQFTLIFPGPGKNEGEL